MTDAGHRIDFGALVNASCWLYPQTDVFIDLANARERDGGDVRFGVRDTEVTGVDGDSPLIRFVDADGTECEIECEVVAGTDGSRSICRFLIPENQRVHYFKEYPFAWFGVLSESPFNAPELIYAHSDRGFALISQRTEKIQRLYFQCPVDEDVETWSNQQIWDELQARVDGDDGFELKQGPIFERTLLRFRSFVAEPMRWGRLVLAGDAAHTVPPTGAKGLNLAINDVRILHECLVNALGPGGSLDALDAYGPRAGSKRSAPTRPAAGSRQSAATAHHRSASRCPHWRRTAQSTALGKLGTNAAVPTPTRAAASGSDCCRSREARQTIACSLSRSAASRRTGSAVEQRRPTGSWG